MNEFVDPNDKSLDYLYNNEMIAREDPNTDVYLKEYNVPQIIASAFALLIIFQSHKALKAFKKADRRRERLNEFDDEFFKKLDDE